MQHVHVLYIAGRIQGCDPCAGGEHPRHRPRALLQAQEGDLRPSQTGRQLAGSKHVTQIIVLILDGNPLTDQITEIAPYVHTAHLLPYIISTIHKLG